MKDIIQQIVTKAAENLLELFETGGLGPIHEMAEKISAISTEMSRDMLSAFIASADKALRDAREERQGDGIKIRESRVPRELYTALGPFKYDRTYFDTPEGRRYILDGILDVEAYERIDAGVSARLVNGAARLSYGRSAGIVTGGQISRQSAWNKAMNTGEVAYVPGRSAETPEALHIFADEDHASLQNGKDAIVPLITVCGGKKRVCEGRNELIEPLHIQGYAMEPEDFWEYAYILCSEKYDLEQIKRIYIYGDGASWIKRGFDVFPNAIHVLDAFHMKKRLKGLLAGRICSAYAGLVHTAVSRNDRACFGKLVEAIVGALKEKMPEGTEKEKKIKTVRDNAGFILNHWGAIQNTRAPGAIGSCTEAMVSHVLSERLSRNPMGWSEAGLSKMSMLRVFVVNGGKVQPADVTAWKGDNSRRSKITKIEKYETIVRQQQDEIFRDAKNWRWFEKESTKTGKRTGTSVALSSLAQTRNIS